MKTKIKQQTTIAPIDLALDTIQIGKQALVFVNTKRSAEKTAEDIAKKIKTTDKKYKELAEQALSALSRPTKQCERLAKVLEKGVAFHHAGLVQKQRALIEDEFRKGTIKIISCTPTLAAGVDLPAFRTIIRDLRRFGHRGMNWIPVLEYQQQAGRAGRPSYDNFGESIAVANSPKEKEIIHDTYLLGEPEEIYSKLAVEPVLRTYLLSLIASEFVNTEKEIFDFFSKTFWAYQFEDMPKLKRIIKKMLGLLEEWELIKTENPSIDEDFVSADKFDDAKGKIEATDLRRRVAQLYLDPLTANHIVKCLRNSQAKIAREFSFLQMIAYTLEMRPLLRVKKKEIDDIQENLVEFDSLIISKEPNLYDPEYETYLNSVKTALMFYDWIEERDEEYLLEEYDVRPGEQRVKLDIADWLLYSTYEIARILQMQSMLSKINKTRLRLKHGAKEELLPLIKLRNVGRVRARKLYSNKIRDIADVKSADIVTLVQILGKKTAIDIKAQVGQDFDESKIKVRKGKRKGQISLDDFQ